MASRLNRPNGWRRLWLAVSAGLAIWFVVVWPLQSLKDMQFGRYGYDRAIEEDFESGQCLTYQTAPLEKLREPRYSEGCWHIYTSRKYDNTVPYTLEARDNSNFATDRNWYLMALGIGAVGTAITSGLVYFLGWLIGWILTGY